jgi:hypothetical protein
MSNYRFWSARFAACGCSTFTSPRPRPHADPEPLHRTQYRPEALVKQLKLDQPSRPPPCITAPAEKPTRVAPQPV